MKTLRFIGMALTAIILTIGFTACSSDDDDNNGAGSTTITSNTKLWAAKSNGQWGYINENGDIVIAAKYDQAALFSCGRALVKSGEKWYYIDTNGNIVNNRGFDEGYNYQNNYAVVKEEGLCGVIDINGNYLIKPTYNYLGNVSTNGLMSFQIQSGGKFGFINTKNEQVIEPQYQGCYDFNNGVACVKLGSKFGAINAQGKWIIQPTYDMLKPVTGKDLVIFSDKSSGGSSTLYGIMDYNGNIKVQALYKRLTDDLTGNGIILAINTNNKIGFIDVNGNTVVPFEYDEAKAFEGDHTCIGAKENGDLLERSYYVIDKTGKIVFTLKDHEYFAGANNGLILTRTFDNGEYTYTYYTPERKAIFTW